MPDRAIERFAVARMQGTQPRMFTGRFETLMTPVTTRSPERARLYDEVVAQAIVGIFNVLHRKDANGNEVAWVAMPVPETRA